MFARLSLTTVALLVAFATPAIADPKITWKKTILDTKFRSEGVAVADVNKDGKLDVLNGEVWYEAPTWKPHEMRLTFKMRPEVYKALSDDKVPEGVLKKLEALKGRSYVWPEDLLAALSATLTKEEFDAHKERVRQRAAVKDYAEGENNVYSHGFCCWAEDLNGDGWPDLIVIDFPGTPCYWMENPKGKDEH